MSGKGLPSLEKKSFFRTDGFASVISSLICILGGIIVGWLVLFILALSNPDIPVSDAFKGIGIILGGPFASGAESLIRFNLGDMLLEATPVVMTGLSVALAFKTGLFNIGAPGQYLMGAMTSLLIALSIPSDTVPAGVIWILAFLGGMAAGAVWGAVPGLFKAFFGVNEVIVCIMTNWIAANVVSWIFSISGENYINIAETKTKFIKPTSFNGVMTPRCGLDKLFPGSNVDISLLITVVIAIIIYVLLNKTTFGYELRACGFNKSAAKYAGMNEKRNIVLSMVIAGALAAGGAALWYLNGKNDFLWNTYGSLPNDGFNGIPIALLANNNPIGVIFSGIFLRYLGKGGFNLAGFTSFNEYVSDLIVAVIIYFAGFSMFIKGLVKKISGRKKEKELEKESRAAFKEVREEGGEDK